MKTGAILAIGGAVALVALASKNGDFWGTPGLSDDDYKALETASTNGTIGSLLKGDTTPAYFTVPGGDLSPAERAALVAALGNKYQLIIDSIADNLATSSVDIYNRIALTLTGALPAGKVLTERGAELYFKMLDIWSANHGTISGHVSNEVTKLWLGAAATDVTTCTATTFVKDITESSTLEQTRSSSVSISTTAKNGFLGIFGKKKSTDEVHLASSFEKRTDVRTIVYVPHCTQYEVDPNKLDVLYNTTIMGVKIQVAQLRQSFNSCPDPLLFCSNG